jgi:hypothetical protein
MADSSLYGSPRHIKRAHPEVMGQVEFVLKGHGFSRAIEASGSAALAAEEVCDPKKDNPSAAEAAIMAMGRTARLKVVPLQRPTSCRVAAEIALCHHVSM